LTDAETGRLAPRLDLPTDRPRPAIQGGRAGIERRRLPRPLADALGALARRQEATRFMVLLAALKVLLARHSGQTDLTVGTAIAGREALETEPLIGFFVNNLALRTRLAGRPSFLDLLRSVRAVTLAAYAHQRVPFERLVEELQPRRDLSRSPLFDVELVLQNLEVDRLELPGLALEPLKTESGRGELDLGLAASETPGGLTLEAEYDRDLFDATTIGRLLGHFETLLGAAAADPGAGIEDLPLLAGAERHQLLAEWNAAAARPLAESCLHRWVERRAQAAPEALAVAAEPGALSYGELDARANRLGRFLRRLGVGPEVTVGTGGERSAELIESLLAVLKAGGAFLPLAADLPPDRLAMMLGEAGEGEAPLVLAGPGFRALPGLPAARLLAPEDRRRWSEESGSSLPGGALAESLAYVLYTSGSTGRPKGVLVTHRGVTNAIVAGHRWFPAGGRVLHAIAPAFDAGVLKIFLALTTGGCLILPPRRAVVSGAEFARSAALHRATVLGRVPSMLDEVPEADLPALGTVMVGGEAVGWRTVARWAPGRRFVNCYGPTEASINATVFEIPPGAPAAARRGCGWGPPIGRPIAATRAQVLSPTGLPLPAGVPGELVLAGLGIARGYRGSPGSTAERFVPDPWTIEPGGRLYRTGDLARAGRSGELEFLGRLDFQVKVRGVRIEPAEVEAALLALAGVREAVVTLRDDLPGGPALAAYVVPTPGGAPPPTELKACLAASLPDIMVPAAFVVLPALPRTATGKVDRAALPAPVLAPAPAAAPARTVVEELVAGLFAELLEVPRVGREASFFDLGGHSLLATRLVLRLRSTFGIELPVRAVFERPTPAGLAAEVAQATLGGAARHEPPLVPVPRRGVLPLSFAQQRLWFLEQVEPANPAYVMQAALRFEGLLNLPAIGTALVAVAARHETLRTTFSAREGEPQQVIHPTVEVGLPVVDLGALPAAESLPLARRLASSEGLHPFDLARGPVFRARLLRLGGQDHVALLSIHHIASDGWSLGVLTREFAACYRAAIRGRAPALPPLAIQYADFATWQRRWLAGEVLAAEVAYWRRQLAGAPQVLPLPSDFPRPAARTFRGALRSRRLPGGLAAALAALCRREGATPFMLYLAALGVLLGQASGRDDLLVGTDVANRNRVEVESLIGFFINQLVLRLNLAGNPTFLELLARVRRVTLEAYAHQDLPFERVAAALLPQERRLATSPLFQVKLILDNTPARALALPAVNLAPFAGEVAAAELDLVVEVEEGPEALTCHFNYNTDLFRAATIERMLDRFAAILKRTAAEPGTRLSELYLMLTRPEREERTMETTRRRQESFNRFRQAKPAGVAAAPERLVLTGTLAPGETLPLAIRPALPDLDPVEWARANRRELDRQLLAAGAILFRGFGIDSPERFEPFAAALCDGLFNENGEHPRESVSGNVYTPVFFPPHQKLLWHNENSFNLSWPGKILFCCASPAREGGETPIVDSRKVFARLPADLVERFLARQVMYMRNYGQGVGLTWQAVFQTEDRAEAERRSRQSGIELLWGEDDRARTLAVRPAAIRHPLTGEMSWFNQAQHFHLSCLDAETRRSIEALYAPEDRPRGCFYGDGSPIEDADMAAILAAYRELEVVFPWQRGDVLLVDNLLTAHGRNPFVGERKLLVAMGEMKSYRDL
jgi:amino acid adenylation domain-containing protein